jgi:hypothetical protein
MANEISGWGDARLRIIEAVHFLCDGKTGHEHADAVIDIIKLVRQTATGSEPEICEPELGDKDKHLREIWARYIARSLVELVMFATERYEQPQRNAVLREIIRLSAWHMPNAIDELHRIREWLKLDRLRQPHPFDDLPKR